MRIKLLLYDATNTAFYIREAKTAFCVARINLHTCKHVCFQWRIGIASFAFLYKVQYFISNFHIA